MPQIYMYCDIVTLTHYIAKRTHNSARPAAICLQGDYNSHSHRRFLFQGWFVAFSFRAILAEEEGFLVQRSTWSLTRIARSPGVLHDRCRQPDLAAVCNYRSRKSLSVETIGTLRFKCASRSHTSTFTMHRSLTVVVVTHHVSLLVT